MKQITKNDSNWHIYQDDKGAFYSIAVKPGCKDTYFCKDIRYLISMIYKYGIYKKADFTEYGLSLITKYLSDYKFKESDLFKAA